MSVVYDDDDDGVREYPGIYAKYYQLEVVTARGGCATGKGVASVGVTHRGGVRARECAARVRACSRPSRCVCVHVLGQQVAAEA